MDILFNFGCKFQPLDAEVRASWKLRKEHGLKTPYEAIA